MELEDNGKRPLSWNGGDSNVKPNDTGLLLHYQSHVDVKYEHSLLKKMLLTRGVPNSIRIGSFSIMNMNVIFVRLHYQTLYWNEGYRECVFTRTRCSRQNCPAQSANAVRHQLADLRRKLDVAVQSVYKSQKIKRHFKPKEHKPPIVSQHNWWFKQTVSAFRVDTFINWRVEEHKRTTISNCVKEEYGRTRRPLRRNLESYETAEQSTLTLEIVFFIRKLKPKMNKHDLI